MRRYWRGRWHRFNADKTWKPVNRKLPKDLSWSDDASSRTVFRVSQFLDAQKRAATEKLAEGIRKCNADARHLQDYGLSQVAAKGCVRFPGS